MRRWSFAVILLTLLIAPSIAAQETPLRVLATSTIIADIARNVGGDLLNVDSLVPANTDIHAFEPLPSDVRRIETADILLINGAGLEAFLGRLLANVATIEPIVVGNGIEMLGFSGDEDHEDAAAHEDSHAVGILGEAGVCESDFYAEETATPDEHEHGECDPHYWENPLNAIIMSNNIAAAFADADPENAETYLANAAAYNEELLALDAELEEILSLIPDEKRVLITNHDFLSYFAERYNFEILATVIPSVTSLAETSPQELSALVNLIRSENIPVIFAETSDSNRLAQVVADEVGQDVSIVSLYSGALGADDSPVATYLDYMRANAQSIAAALGN